MAWKNLQAFISALEQAGELVRISHPVDPVLEITEIADRMIKAGGPALLFENTGTAFPVLMNTMGSLRRIEMALNRHSLNDFETEMTDLMNVFQSAHTSFIAKFKALRSMQGIASWMPVSKKGRGACQEVVMTDPDLTKLPVLTCWPHDGGPFITFPLVHTRDPENAERNLGMYRMQVFDKQSTGMHWHRHKHGAAHYAKYKEKGERMPVTVVLGGDPAYTYAATAPLPDHIDEYILAGFLRRKRVELVRCLTNDLEVPADADIVIEGYVDPSEEWKTEGPFGDHTGFYSLEDLYPVFHITAITHRKDAVYPATIVGIPPQEDAWIGKATERIFLMPMKTTLVPELVDISMPKEGAFHNVAVVSIRKTYPGQAAKVMNALWGAGQMMFNKIMVVVDQSVNVHDADAILKAISANLIPVRDLHSSRGPLDVLDHASNLPAIGGKIGLDATVKLLEEVAPESDFEAFEGKINLEKVKEADPAIRDLWSGLDSGHPILIIALEKKCHNQVRKLADKLEGAGRLLPYMALVVTEHLVPPSNLHDVLWRVSGNLDAVRDCFILNDQNPYGVLVVDGTRKYRRFDNFLRPWPNIIVMDQDTIQKVDEKWDKLGIGPMVPSPSLKYVTQKYKGDALAWEAWHGKVKQLNMED